MDCLQILFLVSSELKLTYPNLVDLGLELSLPKTYLCSQTIRQIFCAAELMFGLDWDWLSLAWWGGGSGYFPPYISSSLVNTMLHTITLLMLLLAEWVLSPRLLALAECVCTRCRWYQPPPDLVGAMGKTRYWLRGVCDKPGSKGWPVLLRLTLTLHN